MFNVSGAGEGAGSERRTWKVLEGRPWAKAALRLAWERPPVSPSPGCPGLGVLPQGRRHVVREHCCYSKTANASGLSLISPVSQPERGSPYPRLAYRPPLHLP